MIKEDVANLLWESIENLSKCCNSTKLFDHNFKILIANS
jgi:hypothetical protein